MVNTVLGSVQQPLGTLYQPGGAGRPDSRVSNDSAGARAKDQDKVQSKQTPDLQTRSSEKSERSEEKTAASYKKDSSVNSGNGQRGQFVNMTA